MPNISKWNWIILKYLFPVFHAFHFVFLSQSKSGMKTTVTEVNAKFLHQPHEDALQPGGGARLVDPAVQEVIVWNVDESWAIDWIRCEFAALTFT